MTRILLLTLVACTAPREDSDKAPTELTQFDTHVYSIEVDLKQTEERIDELTDMTEAIIQHIEAGEPVPHDCGNLLVPRRSEIIMR